MQGKNIWLGIFTVSGVVVLWMLGSVLIKLQNYYALEDQATAMVDELTVKRLGQSDFRLEAHYHFEVGGEIYQGRSVNKQVVFPNQFAAEKAAEGFSEQQTTVWYSKLSPKKSSLNRAFPYKECFHLILTLGVFAYFLWLRGFVSRSREEDADERINST